MVRTGNRELFLTIIGVTAVLLLAACGGGTEESDTGDTSSGTVAKTPGTSGFLELLKVIPDNAQTRGWVHVNDYQRFRETFNLELPGPEAGDEALMDYLLRPVDMPQFYGTFISGYGQTAPQALERRRYLGFDLRNVHRSAEAGLAPGVLEVVQGDFDPGVTARALAACTECEAPEETERHGIKFYSWGEDLRADLDKILAPPSYDRLGRGGRIAVLEDYVFRTVETRSMRRLIDASLGRRDSLADEDEFRLLAAGLDELNTYSGFLSDKTQSLDEYLTYLLDGFGGTFTQREAAQLGAKMEEEPMLRPYDAFATGAGRDDRGQYMAVVLVHSSERAARRNVDLLRRRIEEVQSQFTNEPWRDFFEEMEIRTDGAVLLGKLWGERTRSLWLRFILQRDPLLLHE